MKKVWFNKFEKGLLHPFDCRTINNEISKSKMEGLISDHLTLLTLFCASESVSKSITN